MNKPHKWAKEIHAYADGKEIEQYGSHYPSKGWHEFDGTFCNDPEWEFRIKPQPKEPQYLYIYGKGMGIELTLRQLEDRTLIGKIKLEQDDEY